ncbi:MAG: hypothetical protein QOF73_2207 [Thermomicrobiales bacterium]|jgi:hypothetical protein|nr:hypothetical protein [Thermomicrobiales bacterium]
MALQNAERPVIDEAFLEQLRNDPAVVVHCLATTADEFLRIPDLDTGLIRDPAV